MPFLDWVVSAQAQRAIADQEHRRTAITEDLTLGNNKKSKRN